MTRAPSTRQPLSARQSLSPNVLGSIYMVIGSLGYVINDALIRAATDAGLVVYQALFIRGIAMTGLFAAFAATRHRRAQRQQRQQQPIRAYVLKRPVLIRVGAEVVSTALFFAALVNLDFANAQTILMLVPFAVTLVAAVALGERVTPAHYLAVGLGFAGVIAVMRPTPDDFSAWSLVVAASAAGIVVREIATRSVAADTPALPIALVTAVAITTMTGVLTVLTGWNPPTTRALVYLAFACAFLIVGYVFAIQTVRVGDLSVSAPFRYSTLVGAVVIGYVAFDESPDALTLVGCALILVAGLWSTRIDRRHSRAARAQARPTTVSLAE